MSALASDIEDERRPSPSAISYRPTANAYNHSAPYPPSTTNTNPSMGHINPAWLSQLQYQQYHEQQNALHSNGTTPMKQQQQQQQRYAMPFSN